MEKLNMVCTMWFLSLNALLMQVSDEGGGIARSGLPRIFTYLYSTAKNPPDLEGPNEGATMAGYGDLQIISMEGYGMFILHSVH
jgi:hypothetical protein